jgi:uncharacterized membrane protein
MQQPVDGTTGGDQAAAAPRRRLTFLDGLRGIAIILMVVNHTSRWWIDVSMGWPRYYLVYGSMVLPAAIFLFLVGFCLPISYHAAPERAGPWVRVAARYAQRGAVIIAAGLLLNVVVFPEDPFWNGGVLQTIGLAIVLLGAVMPLMRHRGARWALLAVSVLAYVAYVLAYPRLGTWVVEHPVAAQIWFFDFPPWPWIAPAAIGLVLGWWWLDARARGAETRYFAIAAAVGVACLVAYVAVDWWLDVTPRFGFKRDLILNRHWTPRGTTNLAVVGGVAGLLALTYWVMHVRRHRLAWLVVFGQTAFMLYVLHQLLAYSLVNRALGWRFHAWWQYWLANAVLLGVLLGLAYLWLAVKRLRGRLTLASLAPTR